MHHLRDFFEVILQSKFRVRSFSPVFTHASFAQENGGRKQRRLLQDDNGNMDIIKVVEWVKNSTLDSTYQNNNPVGQVGAVHLHIPQCNVLR